MEITAIQTAENGGSEIAPQDFTKTAGEYLASMGNKLPATQRTQFIEICRAFCLNPFKREIYAIPYGNDFNIIVGFEVYLKRAERSGKLSGWKVWTEGEGGDIKAVIEIHRKDFEFPFIHEVYLSEYSTGKSMWAKSPKTMIKKVAMSQGFRLCFPDELSGIPYTKDEMPENPADEALRPANIPENQEPEAPLFSANSFQEEK